MKTSLTCLIFATLASFTGFCQLPFERVLADTMPAELHLGIPELRTHILNGIPDEFKTNDFDRTAFRFSDQNALLTDAVLSSGYTFTDWPELDNYINTIFERIIPEELKNDSIIHAYLRNDGSYNAFMLASGTCFINLGVISESNNEATIAAILAHELAHYYSKHSLEQFMRKEEGEFRPYLFIKNNTFERYSQKNELESDSLAASWMMNAGYSLDGINNALQIIKRQEENRLKRTVQKKLTPTTHPLSSERLKQQSNLKLNNEANSGRDFIVGKELFETYQKAVKPLILKDLLNNGRYSSCVESAFRFHIEDPTNTSYYYYIMEGLRRAAYSDPNFWNQNFITFRYFEKRDLPDGKWEKVPVKKSLFQENAHVYLKMDSMQWATSMGNFYWNGNEQFKTNEEAFNFFYELGANRNQPECILSCALSYSNVPEIRNQLLNQYLAFPHSTYKEYAEQLIEENLQNSLVDSTILVFHPFNARIRQGKLDIPLRSELTNIQDQIKETYSSMAQRAQIDNYYILDELKHSELNKYVILREMYNLSRRTSLSSGQRNFLNILDPRYWYLMKELGVNEIHFAHFSYLETRKQEKTLDAYKATISTDLDSLLSIEKSSKFLDIYLTCIRDIPDATRSVRYYNRDEKLSFKENGQDQLVNSFYITWNSFLDRKAKLDKILIQQN